MDTVTLCLLNQFETFFTYLNITQNNISAYFITRYERLILFITRISITNMKVIITSTIIEPKHLILDEETSLWKRDQVKCLQIINNIFISPKIQQKKYLCKLILYTIVSCMSWHIKIIENFGILRCFLQNDISRWL